MKPKKPKKAPAALVYWTPAQGCVHIDRIMKKLTDQAVLVVYPTSLHCLQCDAWRRITREEQKRAKG